MKHNIKINHRFVSDILNGNKRFEIRSNDRVYQKGDYIRFSVVDDIGTRYYELSQAEKAKLNVVEDQVDQLASIVFEITFVISGWGLKNGYVAFGIKEAANE